MYNNINHLVAFQKNHQFFAKKVVKIEPNFDHSIDPPSVLVLTGGSFGGKTKACKILAASLQAVKGSTGKAPTCVLLNPKSVKIDQVQNPNFSTLHPIIRTTKILHCIFN
jgi:ABC-type dipeptide/oligopeptide/nickel transport system ATPase subunit